MNTHADKTQENKSQSVANGLSQKQDSSESTFQFVDNRPEAVAQRKLQEMANNSPKVSQLMAFQEMADNHASKQEPIQRKFNIQDQGDNGNYNSEQRLIEVIEMIDDPLNAEYAQNFPARGPFEDLRVRTLARDRNKFVFASWDAMNAAIKENWGDNPIDTVPSEFIIAGDWAQAPPLPTRGLHMAGSNVALDTLLPEEAPDQVDISTTGGWPLEEDATEENANTQEAALMVAYNVCGTTAQNLIGTIQAKGGKMQLVYEKQFEGMDEASSFEELMMSTVARTTFFDITIRQVHEFTIEKHADGRQVLHQGYLSGYNALWWAGHSDELISEAVAAYPQVAEARNLLGRGTPFNREILHQFVGKLGAFMRTDVYGNPESTTAWADLPFHPGETNPATYQQGDTLRENTIKIQVKAYQPQNEAAALAALGGEDGSFLTNLVLNEVALKKAQIDAAKGL